MHEAGIGEWNMWNRSLNNAGRPDPFGAPDKTGGERLSAGSSKCPTCAANLFYQPELKGLMCRNCGNIYDPQTMNVLGSFGAAGEHDYVGDVSMSEDDRRRHEIVCDSCGAAMIADENTMSTMCPFCGSPALITRRMTREFKPEFIIPFKVDRKQAEKNMNEWLATRKYTPWGFKSKSRLTKMTALYVPFWLLDCNVNTEVTGTVKKIVGSGTATFEVISRMTYYVKGVPFDASLKIANKLMEAIEPFDYREMVRFESKYLQGFYADKYDQNPGDLAEKMINRMDSFSLSAVDTVARKYGNYETRPEKNFSWMSEVKTKYCLLPVWFMTVEFDGRQYQFAVNGQTGEASGQVPTTSATDWLESFVSLVRSNWKYVPVAVAVIIPFILFGIILKDPGAGPVKTFFVVLLSVLEFLTIASIVLGFVFFWLSKGVSHRIRKVADEVNDFDKDPGLDQYLDTTRPTTLKSEEKPLSFIVAVRDADGREIGNHVLKPY